MPLHNTNLLLILGCILAPLSTISRTAAAAEKSESEGPTPAVVTRLCWQDRATQELLTADVVSGKEWTLRRHVIQGFPDLDSEAQNLVQMRHHGSVLMTGVRDNADGEHCSGWVAIHSGVTEEAHGDHSHWRYNSSPKVLKQQLNKQQGNPAHLYLYDDNFILANDRRNGFTRLSPQSLIDKSSQTDGSFFSGGGNHITIACTGNVGYATWIDGGGPNAGRVDVVDLSKTTSKPAYTFTLPTGGIHGAIENEGRIFLAPSDGICWLDADKHIRQSPDDIVVHHLSLGTDEETEKPLRTGAFARHRNWVLFATGSGSQSAIGVIDAAAEKPSVSFIKLPATDGLRPTTPAPVLSAGRRYVLCFLNRTDSEATDTEKLCIIDLDPDRNRDISDAKLLSEIPVSPSRIRGHYGHHGIAFDAYGRFAFVTQPEEGRIGVLRLKDRKWMADFDVGGHPDTVVAIGGMEFED